MQNGEVDADSTSKARPKKSLWHFPKRKSTGSPLLAGTSVVVSYYNSLGDIEIRIVTAARPRRRVVLKFQDVEIDLWPQINTKHVISTLVLQPRPRIRLPRVMTQIEIQSFNNQSKQILKLFSTSNTSLHTRLSQQQQ
jgi:hypothetical protein